MHIPSCIENCFCLLIKAVHLSCLTDIQLNVALSLAFTLTYPLTSWGHNLNTPQKFFVSSFEFSTQISDSSLHQGKIKSFCFLFCSMSRTPISQTQSDLPVAARRRSLEGRERKPWRFLSR